MKNPAAQALGRLGRGRPKTLTEAERRRRADWARGLAIERANDATAGLTGEAWLWKARHRLERWHPESTEQYWAALGELCRMYHDAGRKTDRADVE